MTTKEYNQAVDLYADNIFRFAIKHLRNETLAKDVVQETFTKVWEKHSNVDGKKAKSYLFTTAYHCIIDTVNKEKRSGDIENAPVISTPEATNFDAKSIIEEALNELPEIQKTLVMLRDYEGYNYKEIAEITELSESQVKVYLFRARKSLKTYVKRIDLVI